MQELQFYLKGYFDEISSQDLEKLESFFFPEKIKKGEFLVKVGKLCSRLSFIRKGYIRVFAEVDGKEVTQWIGGPGSFITEMGSLIFDKPSRFHIQALDELELFSLDAKDYANLSSHIPSWSTLERLFIAKCFIAMEDRIFTHLSMTAEERYKFYFEHNKELFNLIPLQYLASLLGMTPETLSRLRRKLILA